MYLRLVFLLPFFTVTMMGYAQGGLIEIPPITAEGIPIQKVEVFVLERDSVRQVTAQEYEEFLSYFHIANKGAFNKTLFDLKTKKIELLPEVESAEYKVFNEQTSGTVTIRWYIKPGVRKEQIAKGMIKTGQLSDLPLLFENNRSELTLFLNGGVGMFVDNNGFFGQGEAFTQGNPIADKPAGEGITAWPEIFLEPGIGGITQIGHSDLYIYGAISGLLSGRIGDDVYAGGSTAFFDIERGYIGFLMAHLGKNKRGKLDVSAGRSFFQLNDGFLFSRYSGSSNAGDRGSTYMSSRTAFQKTALATYTNNFWTVKGFFLEPQELFKDRQTNINYTGVTIEYNNNKSLDANISIINRTGGKGSYALPDGVSIEKEGLWIINPKLWMNNINNTGLFLKSEYVYESKSGMSANAWYIGVGLKKQTWKMKPSLYYRYAFMQGDDPNTETYERFDPLLTGGLGTWVQGLNYRKIIGNGNIISNRIQLQAYPVQKLRLSMDAFFLRAHQLNNLGGMAPIAQLQSKDYGQEYTLEAQYAISRKFLLLGIVSTAHPGSAITDNLPNSKSWQTYQLSLFMFL
ncbi:MULTISPECIES: hypothetical protein [unclassified Carboxylicivirga]|uniref:hypothetical protein n=1 Tax=Carboxylicivirga TaxID=1628153 RepID=UPI003D325594